MDRLCGVLFLLVLAAVAHSQDIVPTTQLGYCDNITVADLGNTVNLTSDGLIAGSISPVSDGSLQRPMIKILDFKFVCEVAGYIRNTIGAVSIVVNFECLGRDCQEVESLTSVILTEQFSYSCNPPNVATPPPPGTIRGTITARSFTTSANLNTSLSVLCGECTTGSRGDDVTHCRACNPLCGGQGRCLATTQGVSSCCSYYLNDACVTACPTGLTGDSETYNCGCDQLTPGNVETIIAYSDRTKVGSVATHSCNQTIGYVLPGTTRERTCSQDVSGWSGNDIVCQLHSCDVAEVSRPDSGTVSYTSTSFGSVATFSCDTGYTLSLGDATRVCGLNGWSGTNLTCEIDCGQPVVSPNVSVVSTTGTTEGDTVTLQCEDGLVPINLVMITCNSAGVWNPNPADLVCQVNCSDPSPVAGVIFSSLSDTTEGANISFNCELGLEPQREDVSVCSSNGLWVPDPEDRICSTTPTTPPPRITDPAPIDCGLPVISPNVSVVSTTGTTEGDTVTLQCEDGLFLISLMITCNSAGVWSPNPAELMCSEIPAICPTSLLPDNIFIVNSTSSHLTYKCSCSTSTSIIKTAVCVGKGTWLPGVLCGGDDVSTSGVSTNSPVTTTVLVIVFFIIGVFGGITGGALVVYGCFKWKLSHQSKHHLLPSNPPQPAPEDIEISTVKCEVNENDII